MKDTYTYTTEKQQKQDDRDRLMIAAQIMAAMVTPNDLCRNKAGEELAAKAVEYADELIKAAKQ